MNNVQPQMPILDRQWHAVKKCFSKLTKSTEFPANVD